MLENNCYIRPIDFQ